MFIPHAHFVHSVILTIPSIMPLCLNKFQPEFEVFHFITFFVVLSFVNNNAFEIKITVSMFLINITEH